MGKEQQGFGPRLGAGTAALLGAALVVGAFGGAAASLAADAVKRPSLEQLRKNILTETPEIRVAKVDHERLAVRRLDIVDDKGVIRMSLASPTPPPIIDGIQYKRAFPVSGLVLFDEHGSERGGIGVADVPGAAAVLALDHRANDAIGWRVMPDGSVTFVMNDRIPEVREPALGNRLIPASGAASRIRFNLAPDGTPSIELADAQDRPRLRLFTDAQGRGGVQFLDARGAVTQTLSGEALTP